MSDTADATSSSSRHTGSGVPDSVVTAIATATVTVTAIGADLLIVNSQ